MNLLQLLPIFLIGLLDSVHCVGMCGGIVGAFASAPSGAPRKRFPVAVVSLMQNGSAASGVRAGMQSTAPFADVVEGGVRALAARCLPAKHNPAGDPADRFCRLSLRRPAPGRTIAPGGRHMFRQLFIAALSMVQVMMYALPLYIAADGSMDTSMADLLQLAGLLLTLPAVLYSAQPFFAHAWAGLRRGAPGINLPVAIGIGAAFIGSVVATLRDVGEVYFDSVTMFIFLLLCSRALELAARRKAAIMLETLQHARPASALRMPDYSASRATETVAAYAVLAGQFILVRPGEAVVADGILIDGAGTLDLSLLSSESRPMQRAASATVAGGAVNTGQAIVVRVTRPASDSTLSVLMKLIERAGQSKPQLARWADQVGVWFVGALLLLAVIVFCIWQVIDPARAWPVAIAILVVSCPCALSLATPAALAAITERLLRQSILVVQPHVLETLHRVTHAIFDKTGTLTAGKPVLNRTLPLSTVAPAWCLQATRAAEQTMGVVRQNLVWATIYNAVAIPAAASGWLDPWMTAAGMSISSVVVVLNAWRLRRMPATARQG